MTTPCALWERSAPSIRSTGTTTIDTAAIQSADYGRLISAIRISIEMAGDMTASW
jgi:hypothetical protein